MPAIHLSLCLSVTGHKLIQCVLERGPSEFHGDGGENNSDSRKARVAEAKMNRKENGGLMKEEPGALLAAQGWPDGCRGEVRRERRKRRRPAMPCGEPHADLDNSLASTSPN